MSKKQCLLHYIDDHVLVNRKPSPKDGCWLPSSDCSLPDVRWYDRLAIWWLNRWLRRDMAVRRSLIADLQSQGIDRKEFVNDLRQNIETVSRLSNEQGEK